LTSAASTGRVFTMPATLLRPHRVSRNAVAATERSRLAAEARQQAAAAALAAARPLDEPAPDPELDALLDRRADPSRIVRECSRRGITLGRVLDWIAGHAKPEAAETTPADVRLRAATALLDLLREPEPPAAARLGGAAGISITLVNCPGDPRRGAIDVTMAPVEQLGRAEAPATLVSPPQEPGRDIKSLSSPASNGTIPNVDYATRSPAPTPPAPGTPPPATLPAMAPAPGGVSPRPAATAGAPPAPPALENGTPGRPGGAVATPPPLSRVRRAGSPELRWVDGKAVWRRVGEVGGVDRRD